MSGARWRLFRNARNSWSWGACSTTSGPGGEPGVGLFAANVSYGANRGVNPYLYPPLAPNRDGVTPLGAGINYPDLGRPDVQAAWGRQYAHLIQDLGIDMIWQDMMCPAAAVSADTPEATLPLNLMIHDGCDYVPHAVCHNAYPMFLLKATHAGISTLRPQTRPFILARGGYAGLQRYAALWTGDNASSWDFLRINLPQVLNLGLSGVPISGSDVGGFATGPIPDGTTAATVVRDGRMIGGVTDPELFVRWMQLGSFLPWFRNHYLGYDKEYQEVYAYGEPVTGICRRFVELRYRMLQLYYDAMYEWTRTGLPIARALFLNDPEDAAVYQHLDDQFFVGKDILVAPILFPAGPDGGPAVRDVYLPAGNGWFVFRDGQAQLDPPVPGGQVLRGVESALDEVPVYVREGAILPMRSRLEQYVGELPDNPLDIHVLSRSGWRSSSLSGRRNQHSRRDGGRLSYDADQPARRGRRHEHSRAAPSRWLHATRTVLLPSTVRVGGAEVGDRRRHGADCCSVRRSARRRAGRCLPVGRQAGIDRGEGVRPRPGCEHRCVVRGVTSGPRPAVRLGKQ